jgi:hypothetical protein
MPAIGEFAGLPCIFCCTASFEEDAVQQPSGNQREPAKYAATMGTGISAR